MSSNKLDKSVSFSSSHFSVDVFLSMKGNKELVLQPDFQRFYIWDRKKEEGLIDSIIRNYPMPPIWLWRHADEEGRTIYEVIDGQQRLTCILKFIENKFKFRPMNDSPDFETYKEFDNSYFDKIPTGETGQFLEAKIRNRIRSYKIPYVEVETDERQKIIDIFKRLNKSATNLNPQELRNAFYTGEFKSCVYALTAKLQDDSWWGNNSRVFQKPSTDRMANHQFVSDLIVAMIEGESQDKSEKLDQYYEAYNAVFDDRKTIEKRFEKVLKTIKGILPDASRFTTNLSDFYTLFLFIDKLIQDKSISLDNTNTQVIRESLKKFELDYALFTEKRGPDRSDYLIFEDYRETIVGRQREKEVRIKRQEIISHLIAPGLKHTDLDPQRIFSQDQKNYIWQSSKDKRCGLCGLVVSAFDDYEPDHIKKWSEGGRTTIVNGQVAHKTCNKRNNGKKKK